MSEGSSSPQTTVVRPALEELHLHRLLVALDGSDSAELALAAALTAATRDRAHLTLLAVVSETWLESAGIAAGAGDPATLRKAAEHHAQRVLREAVDRLPGDIPVTTVVRHGKPGPEIVAQSSSGNYDAIVLGARGLGRIGALIGSVSTYVMHHADTAVFVARTARD